MRSCGVFTRPRAPPNLSRILEDPWESLRSLPLADSKSYGDGRWTLAGNLIKNISKDSSQGSCTNVKNDRAILRIPDGFPGYGLDPFESGKESWIMATRERRNAWVMEALMKAAKRTDVEKLRRGYTMRLGPSQSPFNPTASHRFPLPPTATRCNPMQPTTSPYYPLPPNITRGSVSGIRAKLEA